MICKGAPNNDLFSSLTFLRLVHNDQWTFSKTIPSFFSIVLDSNVEELKVEYLYTDSRRQGMVEPLSRGTARINIWHMAGGSWEPAFYRGIGRGIQDRLISPPSFSSTDNCSPTGDWFFQVHNTKPLTSIFFIINWKLNWVYITNVS